MKKSMFIVFVLTCSAIGLLSKVSFGLETKTNPPSTKIDKLSSEVNRQVIDVHCHLFNAQYAIDEFAVATWDLSWGNYPHQKGRPPETYSFGVIERLQSARNFAAWIARLLHVALSDCNGNYNTEKGNFKQSSLGNQGSLMVAPLMMDIYFALDDNKDEEKVRCKWWRAAPIVKPFAIPDNQKDRFNDHFKYIKNLILDEIGKLPETRRPSAQKLDAIFEDARQELLAMSKKLPMDYQGIELSPGYMKHMHDLEALSQNYPNEVFPFLAVDPRRIGIMKLIEIKVNKGKGNFKGIKLYTPLGYLPTHPNLKPIYEYCSKYDIPITVHCSDGLMQNFRSKNYVKSWEGNNHLEDFKATNGNKAVYYTAPEKWLPVLKEWPNLRINFAHFGGGDNLDSGNTVWLKAIIEIMQKHRNVYADISYYSKPGLAQKISDLVHQNEILNTRLMFGTDYVMLMLDEELGGLDRYFDRFNELNFTLLYDNAKNFLKR